MGGRYAMVDGKKNSKYKLVDTDTKVVDGHVVKRIEALKDFGEVKAGDLGGYIESEANLDMGGHCWIYDDAVVYGDAKVADEAIVKNNAIVKEHAFVGGRASIIGNTILKGNAWMVAECTKENEIINKPVMRREEQDIDFIGSRSILFFRTDTDYDEGLNLLILKDNNNELQKTDSFEKEAYLFCSDDEEEQLWPAYTIEDMEDVYGVGNIKKIVELHIMGQSEKS